MQREFFLFCHFSLIYIRVVDHTLSLSVHPSLPLFLLQTVIIIACYRSKAWVLLPMFCCSAPLLVSVLVGLGLVVRPYMNSIVIICPGFLLLFFGILWRCLKGVGQLDIDLELNLVGNSCTLCSHHLKWSFKFWVTLDYVPRKDLLHGIHIWIFLGIFWFWFGQIFQWQAF